MSELWDVQSDEINPHYEEEQALLAELFGKAKYSLEQIINVIKFGNLTFHQLLERYEDTLKGWVDNESLHVYQMIKDGDYLSQVWTWINDEGYKQWVEIYHENEKRLDEIAEYYNDHDDFGFDLHNSAKNAKNELYLAQTQPGNPYNDITDSYTGEEILLDKSPDDTHGSVRHPEKETGQWKDFKEKFLNPRVFNTDFFSRPKKETKVEVHSSAYYAFSPDKGLYRKAFDSKPAPRQEIAFIEAADTHSNPERIITAPKPKRQPSTDRNIQNPYIGVKIEFPDVDRFPFLENRPIPSREDYWDMYLGGPTPQGDGDFDRMYLEEDDLFDDREVTSVPIKQANETELNPKHYLSLRYSDVGKKIHALRKVAIDYRKENYLQRRDWKLLKLPRKPRYMDEDALQRKLRTNHKTELDETARGLTELAYQGEAAQDLLLLLIDGTYFDFLSYKVRLPGNAYAVPNLREFGLLFADEVMDYAQSVQDPPGWQDSSELYYAQLLADYKPSLLYDELNVETSELFNEVVLEHIFAGKSVNEAYKQAHHACKMAQSQSGESAYRQVVAAGKSYGQAMHAFYEAAYEAGDIPRPRDRVISVHPDKMVVLTASSDYAETREVNWNIAKLKARNGELYVPAEAPITFKQKLFIAVRSLRWQNTLIASLKE